LTPRVLNIGFDTSIKLVTLSFATGGET
jgi:hypothetical protein